MGVPISSLPAASALTGAELLPVVQSGQTKRTTTDAIPYVPAGTGAVATTVQSKLRESVSVFDFMPAAQIAYIKAGNTASQDGAVVTVAIQAAVTHCFTTGDQLYWPDGTYLTTASITNFHGVKHEGPGAVMRGSDVFYVQPNADQANALYVSPSASAGNDGLSASQPIKLMSEAFAALKNYGPVLNGTWTVKLAASSDYDYGVTLDAIDSKKQIVVEGPDVGGHPNVPTVVVGPSASTAASGWRFTGCNVKVLNVKFINFRSSSSAFGLAITERGSLETDNVHVNNDTTGSTRGGLGIVANALCILKVRGGIIERCAEGIRSLFDCYHSIGTQNAGNLLSGPVIRNNTVGFSAREASSGHSDWVSYEDNDFGISSEVNARVNCSLSDFKRNVVAIRVRDGNVLRTSCTYNLDTADANTEVIRSVATGTDLTSDGNSLSARVRYRDVTTATSHTGSTSETVLASYTLTAGDYTVAPSSTYAGKCIRVKARGSMTGTAGAKIIRLRFGGLVGTNMNALTAVAASAGRWEYEADVFVRGNNDERVNGKLFVSQQNPLLGAGSLTYSMGTSENIDLVVTGQLGNSTDAVMLDFFQVEVEG